MTDNATYVDPAELLNALRWREDMRVISPDYGVPIYLKKCHGGLTQCCFADDPCEWHRPNGGDA